eukprot:TRINITY_DN32949_c0_g1_i1.p1 TRINITY_DN32949_c0_g1~~TRINITY_DN32949_c0_g1_i1.p1  ORF type:complete len:647 (+),score=217.73 TRINITY_DN32949_c0_g1_i1:70-2010(+)
MSANQLTVVNAQVLRRDAQVDEADPFDGVMLELPKESSTTILERLDVQRGFLCHAGRIHDESVSLKQWFDGKSPVVVVPVNNDYIETPEVRENNAAERLVEAGVPVSHALKALGRAYWHGGFHEFADTATSARLLVAATLKEPYNERLTLPTIDQFGCLNASGPFRETVSQDAPEIIFAPHVIGSLDPPQVTGMGQAAPRYEDLSIEELSDLEKRGAIWRGRSGYLERASRAVVRVFGFHEVSDNHPRLARTDVDYVNVDDSHARYASVPFTAFFVAPTLLMCTRSCLYDPARKTYASHFMYTHRVRASLGMLREGVDMWRCKEVEGIAQFLVDKIRSIGVELTSDKVPPGNMAVPWNDLMLFEVPAENKSSHFLLPDTHLVEKGDDLAGLYYPERPRDAWINEVMGPDGHDKPDVGLREFFDTCWGFDVKMAALGETKRSEDTGIINHTCSLLPGSGGSPLFSRYTPIRDEEGEIYTFVGISTGRCRAEHMRQLAEIEQNNTAGAAARVAKSLNMYNSAISIHHITFVLLYQQYILPEFARAPEGPYLQKLFQPYEVFVRPAILQLCHRKMLKDAEDYNEWGLAFWKRHDADSALYCFREGARMFCIATIPDMSEAELKLKDALQTNVAALVTSRLEIGTDPVFA